MQSVHFYNDQELIHALCHKGTMDNAIRFLYKEYYGMLEAYVINNNGSTDDAADVVQETIVAFVDIVQNNKFRGEASVKTFLYTIAKNTWLAAIRKNASADNRNMVFEKSKDVMENEVTHYMIKKEYYDSLMQLLDKLGDKCKQLLLLVYYEDLSMKEILEKVSGYENEQVLRNKKYKCMKQLENMVHADEKIYAQLKNALRYGG